MVFITDSEQIKQCSTCPPQPNLDVSALQNAVAQLFSTKGVNQSSFLRLSSYSLNDVSALLNGSNPPPNLESDLVMPRGWFSRWQMQAMASHK